MPHDNTGSDVYDLEMVGVRRHAVRDRVRLVVLAAALLSMGMAIGLMISQWLIAPTAMPKGMAADRVVGIRAADRSRMSQQLVDARRTIRVQADAVKVAREKFLGISGAFARQRERIAVLEDALRTVETRKSAGTAISPVSAMQPRLGQAERGGERSTPPGDAEQGGAEPFEMVRVVTRVVRIRQVGVTLQDVARRYGVSLRRLRGANPELGGFRGRAGEYLPRGAAVLIPGALDR